MTTVSTNGHCECGESSFTLTGNPLLRVYCHCTICQAYNQAPYGDITMFRPKDVLMPNTETVTYKSYQAPGLVQRGSCNSCGKPAVEYIKMISKPNLIIVPNKNIEDKTIIPEPSIHIFYDSRVVNVDDNLPKFNGYLSSQIALGHKLMSAIIKHR